MPISKLSPYGVEIDRWIHEKLPKASMCRELGCRPSTLDRYLKDTGRTYVGNIGAKGHKRSPARKPAVYYLKLNGPFINSHGLKGKLVADGLRKRECRRCLMVLWLGAPIPLELHHENGNRHDNRDQNIKLLCPNCHALTENNSGRANKRR